MPQLRGNDLILGINKNLAKCHSVVVCPSLMNDYDHFTDLDFAHSLRLHLLTFFTLLVNKTLLSCHVSLQ
jgi:hypothetical protein